MLFTHNNNEWTKDEMDRGEMNPMSKERDETPLNYSSFVLFMFSWSRWLTVLNSIRLLVSFLLIRFRKEPIMSLWHGDETSRIVSFMRCMRHHSDRVHASSSMQSNWHTLVPPSHPILSPHNWRVFSRSLCRLFLPPKFLPICREWLWKFSTRFDRR